MSVFNASNIYLIRRRQINLFKLLKVIQIIQVINKRINIFYYATKRSAVGNGRTFAIQAKCNGLEANLATA